MKSFFRQHIYIRASSLILLSAQSLLSFAAESKQPNVVMIAVDDLNQYVRHLNYNKQSISPNIDKLAAKGVSFHRAYAPAALCNATRSALMSGLSPSTTGIYSNGLDWRRVIGDGYSLPYHFKKNGYEVLGGGKIFHNDRVIRGSDWSFYYHPTATSRYSLEGPEAKEEYASTTVSYTIGNLPISELAGGDDVFNDYHVARWAADEASKKHDKPFFLGVGIFRPHLPWEVPKKYFDMFPVETIELPPHIENDFIDIVHRPSNMKEHQKILAEGELAWKKAIRAYLASIAYADAQIGRVLTAIENGPNKDNTIIVLWGDHGWQLGEKNTWRKVELWEESTRTPYIWYVPKLTKAGDKTDTPVSLQSLWPTLAELTRTHLPSHVQGKSLVTLLKNTQAKWNEPVVTTNGFKNHAVRVDKLRYISYHSDGEELYDHTNDIHEYTNLIKNPEYAKKIVTLKKSLPKVNRQWEDAASLYGGDPAYGGETQSKNVGE